MAVAGGNRSSRWPRVLILLALLSVGVFLAREQGWLELPDWARSSARARQYPLLGENGEDIPAPLEQGEFDSAPTINVAQSEPAGTPELNDADSLTRTGSGAVGTSC